MTTGGRGMKEKITKNTHNIDSVAVSWTKQAKDCYFSGFSCRCCSVYRILSDSCRMKESVISLIRRSGRPKEDK